MLPILACWAWLSRRSTMWTRRWLTPLSRAREASKCPASLSGKTESILDFRFWIKGQSLALAGFNPKSQVQNGIVIGDQRIMDFTTLSISQIRELLRSRRSEEHT